MSLDIDLLDPSAIYEADPLYEANITHNLTPMANKAGIYKCLWRPEENGFETAGQLIEPLKRAIEIMQSNPEEFRKLDAKNGWGTYDQFLPWLIELLENCEAYPMALIESDR